MNQKKRIMKINRFYMKEMRVCRKLAEVFNNTFLSNDTFLSVMTGLILVGLVFAYG